MTVYIVNISLILIFGYFFLYRYKNNKNKKIYCGLVALQWILISGLRHVSIGADTYNYLLRFEETKTISWNKIFDTLWDYIFKGTNAKDPGYFVFQKFFQIFSDDYQLYLICIATIFMSFMAVWIYKNSKDPCFSFILFSSLFYSFYAVTGHRQTIATALIVFIGYEYIKERKLIKFLLLAFAAFLVHKSSLAFIPFYFIANIPITLPYAIIALVVIAAVAISGKSLYGVVADWMGFGEEQINYAVGGAETYAAVLTLMCVIILVFYFFYKNKTENATRIFNITLLTLMSSLLVFQNQSFMRIQQYYSLFLMISFPEVIVCFDKKGRVIAYIVTMAVLIAYLIRNNPQYLFFWQ